MCFNFSIIIPHKNIPKLLQRCLDSIPNRPDIQIIIVDDNSDSSIVDFDNFPGIGRPNTEVFFDKSDKGAGRARNIGLNYIRGYWTLFLDADDLLVDNANEIFDEAVNHSADILFYSYTSVYSDNLEKKGTRDLYLSFFSQYAQNGDEAPFRYSFQSLWGKIIKSSLIHHYNIQCDETLYANDVSFSLKCGVYAKTILIVDKPFYVITQRNGSLASSQFNGVGPSVKECRIRLNVNLKAHDFLKNHKIPLSKDCYMASVCTFYSYHKFPLFFMLPLYFIKYPYQASVIYGFYLSKAKEKITRK